MSAISDFQKMHSACLYAKRWVDLIGSSYKGGGGGIGKVAHTSCCNIELYHQAYDGATNYHEASGEELKTALNTAFQAKASEIIKDALATMENQRVNLAAAAKSEAESIIALAGGQP